MVEVDLQLFVTCRLCLDVQGHFQIDPNVQQQIKYCFDIDVEPFDGLPQLICKKCENIVREHYVIKKKFTEKQKELKTRLQDNAKKVGKSPRLQQDESDNCAKKTKLNDVPSSRLDDSDMCNYEDDHHEKSTRKKKKVKKKRIINRVVSSSDDDLESNEDQTNTKANNLAYSEEIISWDANFNKYFVCRICSQGFQKKEGITTHMKNHDILQKKYENVFKMSCLVVMERSDNKPNMCNNNKAVVYSPDSVIQNTHNPFYYRKYHPKTYSDITNPFKYISKNIVRSADSSDGEALTPKRPRLSSRSSSETVVLNRHSEQEDTPVTQANNKNPPKVIDCIDLSSSSDNGSDESNEKSTNSSNKDNLDLKPMHNIIKMCVNKYNKKTHSREKNIIKEKDKVKEEYLQHKVLSIGRKIINNKGFNCTGLLRFLEYKELSVIWKETSVLKANNESKYVRIATRVRGNENSDPSTSGWKKFKLFKFEHEENFRSMNILKKLKTFANFKKPEVISVTNEGDNMNPVEKLPRISSVFSHTDLEISKIDSDNLLLHKLLNKNPVSNPKQLPKKVCSNDSNLKTVKVFSAPNTIPFINVKQIEGNIKPDTNPMPIVTSTVSLAHLVDKQKNDPTGDSEITTNIQQPIYPRIKVKPVSELMPEKPTENINSNMHVNGAQIASQISSMLGPTQNIILDKQQSCPSHTLSTNISNTQMWQNKNNSFIEQQVWPNPNIPLSEQHNMNSVNNVSKAKVTDTVVILKEYMLLDTVEFPNTKTTSPFDYLKDLLSVHNITLIDADQPLSAGSVCLIKLKLVYQQEKCEPISLCSSLYCFKNTFSIQIKDLNLRNINVNNLSANWQWQLLKIYNDEVTNKVLQTAAKIGQDTYRYTQEFFGLLKSIKLKNEDMTMMNYS